MASSSPTQRAHVPIPPEPGPFFFFLLLYPSICFLIVSPSFATSNYLRSFHCDRLASLLWFHCIRSASSLKFPQIIWCFFRLLINWLRINWFGVNVTSFLTENVSLIVYFRLFLGVYRFKISRCFVIDFLKCIIWAIFEFSFNCDLRNVVWKCRMYELDKIIYSISVCSLDCILN